MEFIEDQLLERLRGCTKEHIDDFEQEELDRIDVATFEQLDEIILDYAGEVGGDSGWGSEGTGAFYNELTTEIADLAGLDGWPESHVD